MEDKKAMKPFMDQDFLLETKSARTLFHKYAKNMPIFDYHCHLSAEEIAKDISHTNISDIWLGKDHYKWRQMRAAGFDESLVTGNGQDPYQKFLAWAETVEMLIGNPLYHFTHLELQRYFGIYEPLSRKTARRIYDRCNELLLTDKSLSAWGILRKFNIYALGTTDDPADDLHWHKKIKEDGLCPAKVIPTFRPDKALDIERPSFEEYMKKLSKASGLEIKDIRSLERALSKRLDYFISLGAKASDHALIRCPSTFKSEREVDRIFKRRLSGHFPSKEEGDAYKTHLLSSLSRMYEEQNIVMQLHLAAIRDNNQRAFASLGPDTGFDASSDKPLAEDVSRFFSRLSETDSIPKTIFYTLNPKDYYPLGTLMGCYQGGGTRAKMQLGSAWWFCDHRDGMEEQMRVLAALGQLPLFVGMLTDSRSLLSFPRHEYFRRILCNLIGRWCENGEIPNDEERLGSIVKDISFENAIRYFGDPYQRQKTSDT